MFKLISEAAAVVSFIERHSNIVPEAVWHINEDEMWTRPVDAANIAMTEVEISGAAFDSYEADGMKLGLNLERLEDVLGLADADDMALLELDPETRKLNIEFSGLDYQLALIDPDAIRKEPDKPNLDLPIEFSLPFGVLDRGIQAADMVADHVEFIAEGDHIAMEAHGDTDDVRFEFDEELEHFNRAEEGKMATLLSVEYLEDLLDPLEKDDLLEVRMGDEFPMKFNHDFAEGNGHAEGMMAPRIRSE